MQDTTFLTLYTKNNVKLKRTDIMKKYLFLSLFVLATLMTSCLKDNNNDDDIIWDVAPINYYITVTDTSGDDLLDSTRTDNILKEVSVSYNGKTYAPRSTKEIQDSIAKTRLYAPDFYGLYFQKFWDSQKNTYGPFMLVFGEFDGMENAERREIILNYNGQAYPIAYSNKFQWAADKSPLIDRKFYFGSTVAESNIFNLRLNADGRLELIK